MYGTGPDADFAKALCQRYARLLGERSTFDNHWQEVAERVLPSHAKSFFENRSQQGEKNTAKMLDATAALALTKFASTMQSLTVPENATWHRLQPSLPELRRDRETALWFEQVNQILWNYRYSPSANFNGQIGESWLMLGAFGNSCMFIDEHQSGQGIRYRAMHLAEVVWVENHQGLVDTMFRKFSYTARQAVQAFGVENLPKEIVDCLAPGKNPDQLFDFVHCVMPNADRDPSRKDAAGMEYASYYVAKSVREQMVVRRGGFSSFPFAVGRYSKAPGEVYGRGPAMLVLPNIKVLNAQKEIVLKQGHRTVDPVLLAADDGIVDSFSLKPGAINAGGVNSDGRALVQALQVGNVAVGKDLMDDERLAINDAFLVTLFQILVETPQMSATEVLERAREKAALLAPTIGRLQSEKLHPMIDRELDILSSQGLLPPMPQVMREARGEYRVEFENPFSRMQRAEEAAGFFRLLEQATTYATATQDPSPLDHFDFDTAIPELAQIQGAPLRWMKTAEAVEAAREGRKEQMQTQQMIDAAPAAAALLKTTAQNAR